MINHPKRIEDPFWYIPMGLEFKVAKFTLISEEESLEAEDTEMKEELINDIKASTNWNELRNAFRMDYSDFSELLRGAGLID